MEEGGPLPAFLSYQNTWPFRILACGGDGTAGWVMSKLEELRGQFGNEQTIFNTVWQKLPSIAVLPLGTGNDLARVMGMGGGYSGGSLKSILEQIPSLQPTKLDRWKMSIQKKFTDQENEHHKTRWKNRSRIYSAMLSLNDEDIRKSHVKYDSEKVAKRSNSHEPLFKQAATAVATTILRAKEPVSKEQRLKQLQLGGSKFLATLDLQKKSFKFFYADNLLLCKIF